MIKINKMLAADRPGESFECESIVDAMGLFDNESKFIVARCSADEEFLGLMGAAVKRAQTAASMGVGDAVWVWMAVMQLADGGGWRVVFEQQQALTQQGAAKQQQAQQAQARQALGQMGFSHPGDGQRGVRR
jgi:hypothetical protein